MKTIRKTLGFPLIFLLISNLKAIKFIALLGRDKSEEARIRKVYMDMLGDAIDMTK